MAFSQVGSEKEKDLSLPLLIRSPILSDEDPILIISFNLNYLLKVLFPKKSYRASPYEFSNFGVGR